LKVSSNPTETTAANKTLITKFNNFPPYIEIWNSMLLTI
jgi:hypothetical protein